MTTTTDISRSDLIAKAVETLDEARSATDIGERDTLTRVAHGYTSLATLPDA